MKKLSILATVVVLLMSGVLYTTHEMQQTENEIVLIAGDEDFDPVVG